MSTIDPTTPIPDPLTSSGSPLTLTALVPVEPGQPHPPTPTLAPGDAGQGSCPCAEIGPYLARGTSGRTWICQTCGRGWTANGTDPTGTDSTGDDPSGDERAGHV